MGKGFISRQVLFVCLYKPINRNSIFQRREGRRVRSSVGIRIVGTLVVLV